MATALADGESESTECGLGLRAGRGAEIGFAATESALSGFAGAFFSEGEDKK